MKNAMRFHYQKYCCFFIVILFIARQTVAQQQISKNDLLVNTLQYKNILKRRPATFVIVLDNEVVDTLNNDLHKLKIKEIVSAAFITDTNQIKNIAGSSNNRNAFLSDTIAEKQKILNSLKRNRPNNYEQIFESPDFLNRYRKSHNFFYKDVLHIETIKSGKHRADIDSIALFKRLDISPKFPTGIEGWHEYLSESLNKNVPVRNGAPIGVYKIMVHFVVSSTGKITNVTIDSDPGYGMGQEVIRVVSSSPDWIPAVIGSLGNVNFQQKQLIIFNVTTNGSVISGYD